MVAIGHFFNVTLKVKVIFSKKEWKPGDYFHLYSSAALLASNLACKLF